MGASGRLSVTCSRSHSSEQWGWDTAPRFPVPEASSPTGYLRRLQPLSYKTGRVWGSNQLPKTQYGVSGLKIVFYSLNLVD